VKQRRVGIIVGAVALVAILAMWALHGRGGDRHVDKESNGAGSAKKVARERVDTRTLERASVAGTIRDETGKPIARRARVRGCIFAESLVRARPRSALRRDQRKRRLPDREPLRC